MFIAGNDDNRMKETGFKSQIVKKYPESEKDALVVKFLLNNNPNRKPMSATECEPMKWWPCRMNPDDPKSTQYRPDREFLGLGRSPEADHFDAIMQDLIEARSKVKALKSVNGKASEIKKAEALVKVAEAKKDMYKPRYGGYIFFTEPNSDTIKALKFSTALKNRIWGRKGNDYIKPVASIVDELSKKGRACFVNGEDAELNKTGWVKIWKTGVGLATEYHIEEDNILVKEKTASGKDIEYLDPKEHDIGKKIKAYIAGEPIPENAVPDVFEQEEKNAWSEEESESYLETGVIPERVMKEYKAMLERFNNGGGNSDAEVSAAPPAETAATTDAGPSTSTENLDDIPF